MNAQLSNFIFFSEGGEKFSIVLNGIMQNASPETNIKITDLNAPNYTVRAIFEDKTLGQLQKQIMLNPGTETTYTLKLNNKGEYVFRFRSEVPIAQSAPPAPQQATIVYTTIAPAAVVVPVANVTYTETTTTTTGGTNENVSMGLNIGGVGLNVNMNINDGNMGGTSSSTTTTYSTTTTTTGTGTNVYVDNTPPPTQVVVYLPGYSGPIGCPQPMDQNSFFSVKQSIASKTFEDSKLTIAKQVINSNCLLSSQVKEIMLLFTFEDTRLELAKYAYGHTYDIGNYYQLNDAFTFESSIDELNAYINGGGF
ncbi:MAG: hypothetical protein A2W98_13750 [Bacteroidetes bacterium GWF2_33_38]|nr:MAG: hypothetical protein A2W98_13750 [Bacteroidetes bacterium GWF2_33_38]OFY88322.1 MAG: hypothetical protein A2236_14035 [Bacteroidetes bacterium RIFOXYA2_FULL_33_7]